MFLCQILSVNFKSNPVGCLTHWHGKFGLSQLYGCGLPTTQLLPNTNSFSAPPSPPHHPAAVEASQKPEFHGALGRQLNSSSVADPRLDTQDRVIICLPSHFFCCSYLALWPPPFPTGADTALPTAATPLDLPTILTPVRLARCLDPAEVRCASKALERSVEVPVQGMASVPRDSCAQTATGAL